MTPVASFSLLSLLLQLLLLPSSKQLGVASFLPPSEIPSLVLWCQAVDASPASGRNKVRDEGPKNSSYLSRGQ